MALKTYQQVLDELEISGKECHLLLGNGFNNSLGVYTSYKEIFKRMKSQYKGYQNLEKYMEKEYYYDVETLIGELKKQVGHDNDLGKNFLTKFIENKVKLDFMKAAYDIVNRALKNIYAEKNEGVYLLLQKFKNYFSLNYDPLLYLLLMKFKGNEIIAVRNQLKLIQDDMNIRNSDIYKEIKKARDTGKIKTEISGNTVERNLNKTPKQLFVLEVKNYFRGIKNWRSKDIEETCNMIWREEKEQKFQHRYINDGFLPNEDTGSNEWIAQETQNVFFLHGAFHIYEKKHKLHKITQKQNKALYSRLEEIVNSETENIVCVLTGTSDDKQVHIQKNAYLKKCFEELSRINGWLVIFGSSLDNKDKHVFQKIKENNKIEKIYISSNVKNESKDRIKVNEIFTDKDIDFFNYETISYSED